MNQDWKTVRVFISSTFRDMQAERDHLVRFVFPRLREALLLYRIHLIDVDLRWGVTGDQDAREVCREVVDECQPRFLCLLGGRYGWVPPGRDRSITADEVYYGVLDRRSPDPDSAYFYFREDSVTAAMVEVTPGEFRESASSDNLLKLAELKRAIVSAGLNPYIYSAQWDRASSRLVSLKSFGDRVYDDLQGSIKSDPELRDRFLLDESARRDEFAEENAAMEAFAEERSTRFVLGSRETVLAELLIHAHATGGNGYICVTGAAGSGKTALLAHLCRNHDSLLRLAPSVPLDSQLDVVFITHFTGATPGSTNVRRTLRRLCHELKSSGAEITAEIPDDEEKLRLAFPDLLRQVCAQRRVVILLDAVNEFESTSHFSGLHWLPAELPPQGRIVVSTLFGPALVELRRRARQPPELELKPLTANDGAAIIEQFRSRFRKRFEPGQRTRLLAKRDAGTPLYLLTALEELRTLGAYEEITRRISELPVTTHELFVWILQRLEDDDGFRDAAGQPVGHELVSGFAALLGASRYGLSERELAEMLDPGDPQGNVAALLQLLRPYLLRRGELLDFYHTQFNAAAEQLYHSTDKHRRAVHARLAAYFNHTDREGKSARSSPIDARVLDELPWQLAKAGDHDGLMRSMTDLPFFMTLLIDHEADATRYFRTLKKSIPLADEFHRALEIKVDTSTPLDEQGYRYLIVGRFFEMQGLMTSAEKFIRKALALDEARYGRDQVAVARDLTTLGLHLQRKGDVADAEPLFLRVLQVLSDLPDPEPSDLASALQNLALHYACVGRYAEAETYCRRALEIVQESLGPTDRNLQPILHNLAGCLNAMNRPYDAEPYERQAVAVGEQAWGDAHPHTARSLEQLAASLISRRPGEAEQLARRAERIYAANFGDDDVRISGPLTVIAQLRQLSYRLPEAEDLFRRALELEQNQEEPNKAKVAFALTNLASVVRQQGRPTEAEDLLRSVRQN